MMQMKKHEKNLTCIIKNIAFDDVDVKEHVL